MKTKIYLLVFINLFCLSCNKNTKIIESLPNSIFVSENGNTFIFKDIHGNSICTATYCGVYNISFDIIHSTYNHPVLSYRMDGGDILLGNIEIIDENTLELKGSVQGNETVTIFKRQTKEDIEKSKVNVINNIIAYVGIKNNSNKVLIYNNSNFTMDEIIYEYTYLSENEVSEKRLEIMLTAMYGMTESDKTKYDYRDTLYFLQAHSSLVLGDLIQARIISIKSKALGIK